MFEKRELMYRLWFARIEISNKIKRKLLDKFTEEEIFLLDIDELIDLGLKGIEVYHSNISYEERLFYLELADKYNLFITGGTDYHGKTVKPDIELGRGRNGNVYVPHNLKILSKIKTS